MKQNVVLIFGGVSCEHDISIITAYQVKMNIDTKKYNIFPVYICKNGVWKLIENFEKIDNFYKLADRSKEVVILPSSKDLYLRKNKNIISLCEVDCIVNCMHGINGEDGSLSGLLQLSNIPCTSSDMLGSTMGIDKCAFKDYVSSYDIPLADYISLTANEYFSDVKNCLREIETKLNYPVIIKPARLGSSIGIKVCKKQHDLANFIENALKFDEKVLIEEYFEDIAEYNIAIYMSLDGMRISAIESPKGSDEILSFNNKYLMSNSGGDYISCSKKKVKLSKKMKISIEEISQKVYRALCCKGVVRFDFILTKDGELYLNEVNTVPGSLANYLFFNTGLDFTSQIDEQIRYAINCNIKSGKIIRFFDSNVLQNIDLSTLNKYK